MNGRNELPVNVNELDVDWLFSVVDNVAIFRNSAVKKFVVK